MGGRSSSSSASATTNYSQTTDNRQVLGDGAIGATSGGVVTLSDMRSYSDNRDMSTVFSVTDSSDRTDNSNRSVNNSGNTSYSTTNTSVDPGALRAMESALMRNEAVTREAFKFADSANTEALDAARASVDRSIGAASSTLDKAFSFARDADVSARAGFDKLLNLGASMFDTSAKAVNKAQDMTAAAYSAATAEKAGALDNKTILILGLAGAAALVLVVRKR